MQETKNIDKFIIKYRKLIKDRLIKCQRINYLINPIIIIDFSDSKIFMAKKY